MAFQGRTVVAMMLVAMFAGSILTMAIMEAYGTSWSRTPPRSSRAALAVRARPVRTEANPAVRLRPHSSLKSHKLSL